MMMDRSRLGTIAVAAWMAIVAAPAAATPPPNDLFDAATVLGDAPVEVTGTNVGASREAGEPLNGLQTVWYAFRPTASRRVAVEVAPVGPVTDRLVGVYTGSGVAALQPIGTGHGGEARVGFEATAGETYRIAVARTWQSGPFTLRIRPMAVPVNDAFDDAQTMGVPFVHAGNLADATSELGEAGAVHSVWYRFRPRRSGAYWIQATGTCASATLYTGSSVDELRAVVPSGNGFRLRRGRIYHAAVDCGGSSFGDYELRLSDGTIKGDGVELEVLPDQTVDSLRVRGARLRLSVARSVEIAVQLRVTRGTARRLGLGSRVIGRLRGHLIAGEPKPAAVRLTRQARRSLAGETRLLATIRLELPQSTARDRFLEVPVSL
jgi:hypothetical protein